MAKTKEPTVEHGGDVPALMAPMMTLNPGLARAWTEMMSGSARFVMDRLRTDLETQKALLACKTPLEVVEVQAAFLNTTVQQYAGEASRILGMTMNASHTVASDLKSGHTRGYDDVPV